MQELGKAVEGWERAGGLRTARASETSRQAATRPPEEYAYRWRKPGDPDRRIAYLSTASDRDQAMKAREDAGYLVTKVDEDPAEPERPTPMQEQPAPKRHGLGL